MNHWDGKAFPPAGTVCEYLVKKSCLAGLIRNGEKWNSCQILAYHGEFLWMDNGLSRPLTTPVDALRFRPIRTPEEKAVDAMLAAAAAGGEDPPNYYRDICWKIYHDIADGKIPGVGLTHEGDRREK